MKRETLLLLLSIATLIRGQLSHFQWAKGIGSVSDDSGNSIAVDSFGNIYTIGNFQSTMNANPGPVVRKPNNFDN